MCLESRNDWTDLIDSKMSAIKRKYQSETSKVFKPNKKFRNGCEYEVEENDRSRSNSCKFFPGAIYEIALRNFMTHRKFEWKPKPRVNLITGPNGAGKSSILQAIVLGLGEFA